MYFYTNKNTIKSNSPRLQYKQRALFQRCSLHLLGIIYALLLLHYKAVVDMSLACSPILESTSREMLYSR